MKKIYSILTLMALLLFANILFANDFTEKKIESETITTNLGDNTMNEIVFKYPSKTESFAELRKIASNAETLFQTLKFIGCEIKILEVNTEFTRLEFTKVEGVKLYEKISDAALEILEFKDDINGKIETLNQELQIYQSTKIELYKVLDYNVVKLAKEKAEKIAKLFPLMELGEIDYDRMGKMTDSIITSINQTIDMIDKGYTLRST